MANNRLFIVRRPTGKWLYFGKRMLLGWYDAPTQEKFEAFFESVATDTPEAA